MSERDWAEDVAWDITRTYEREWDEPLCSPQWLAEQIAAALRQVREDDVVMFQQFMDRLIDDLRTRGAR